MRRLSGRNGFFFPKFIVSTKTVQDQLRSFNGPHTAPQMDLIIFKALSDCFTFSTYNIMHCLGPLNSLEPFFDHSGII